MVNETWVPWLLKLNIPEIDTQIAALKDRIRNDQSQIVFLTIIRKGLQRTQEFRTISQKRTEAAIDEAIAEANNGTPPLQIRTDAEGHIKPT